MMQKDLIRRALPGPIDAFALSAFNWNQYRLRRGGKYSELRSFYSAFYTDSRLELETKQEKLWDAFVRRAAKDSPFYRKRLQGLSLALEDIGSLPFLEKSELVVNAGEILTIDEKDGVVSYTGGTTGASLRVVYSKDDVQGRQAVLDLFREQHGYRLRAPTLWFTGKDFLRPADRTAGRFVKHDVLCNILFVSTFDISSATAGLMLNDVDRFAPEFAVGFPSSMERLLRHATPLERDRWSAGVVFPTAETVSVEFRELMADVGTRVADQYASSEGAPFITECSAGSLHLNPLTGVFEILDESGRQADEGELVVTSFSTSAVPLIRYRVGDRIRLSSAQDCACGCAGQIVDAILGREDDYAIDVNGERINLGNLSNCTKGVEGIVEFQIRQSKPGVADVAVVADRSFGETSREKFLAALKVRFGVSANLEISVVSEIQKPTSGKHRLVVRTGDVA